MYNLKNVVEAIIFAAGQGISLDEILEHMPELDKKKLNKIIDDLKEEYCGKKGIHLLTFNKKVQFSSNTNYGDIVSEVLTPLKERELSKALLEVMSIVAYKQPVTRVEIEEIRGVNCDYSLGVLHKMNLVKVIGRKDTPGRPSLYATTDEFLKKFQLHSIDDLPDYGKVLEKIKIIEEDYDNSDNLYKDILIDEKIENSIEYSSDEIDINKLQ